MLAYLSWHFMSLHVTRVFHTSLKNQNTICFVTDFGLKNMVVHIGVGSRGGKGGGRPLNNLVGGAKLCFRPPPQYLGPILVK